MACGGLVLKLKGRNLSNKGKSKVLWPNMQIASTVKQSPGKETYICEGSWQDNLQALDRYCSELTELHEVQASSMKRAEEVHQLQQALSSSHKLLYDERDRLLKLQRANDDLRLKELDQQRQIKALQSHCQLAQCSHPQCGGSKSHGATTQGTHATSTADILVPSAIASSIVEQIEALQLQLAEQIRFSNERAAAAQADKEVRCEEEAAHRAVYQAEINTLTTRLARAEQALCLTTRDLILVKRAKADTMQQLMEVEAGSARDAEAASKSAAEAKRAAVEEMATLKRKGHTHAAQQRAKMREQREQVAELEEHLKCLTAAFEDHLQRTEQQLAQAHAQVKALEARRAMDMEGWGSDVAILRKQLAATSRKAHQNALINRLSDDERLKGLLDGLQRRAPDVDWRCGNEGSSKSKQTSVEMDCRKPEEELAKVHDGICFLERRLAQTQGW